MSVTLGAFGGNLKGKANATAGTAFYVVFPGSRGHYTRVIKFGATSGNTANSITVMRPLGRAAVTGAKTTSDDDLVLDSDPSPSGNTIAANDICVVEHTDGTYRQYVVNTSGWNSTTKTVTFTANLGAAVSVGAKFFNFGINSDTDPEIATPHPILTTTANAAVTYTFEGGGAASHDKGDPVLFYCPNATNATVIDYAEYVRTRE